MRCHPMRQDRWPARSRRAPTRCFHLGGLLNIKIELLIVFGPAGAFHVLSICDGEEIIALNARLKWPDEDDYLIWQEEHAIGRIRLVADPKMPATPWEWSVTVPLAMPEMGERHGQSRDTCMKGFSSAWARFLKETPSRRLERAWGV
jgi:hypothetical protein